MTHTRPTDTRALGLRRRRWSATVGPALVGLAVLALPTTARAADDAPRVALGADGAWQAIGGQLALHEDPTGQLDRGQIRKFSPSTGRVPNLGLTRSTVWARVVLVNPGDAPLRRVLSVENPTLDEVVAHIGQGPPRISGRSHPKSQRELPRTSFSFRVVVPPKGELPVLLRLRSLNEMHLQVSVASEEALWARDGMILAWDYLAIGFLVAIALYTLLLFGALRDPTFGYYGAYVLLLSVWLQVLDGSLLMRLPDAVEVMPRWPYALLGYGAWVPATLFTRRFLGTAEHTPALDRVLLGLLAAVGVAGVLGMSVLPWEIQNSVGVLLNALLLITCFVTGVVRWRAGYQPAVYFTLGWGALLALGVTVVAITVGALPTNDLGNSVMLRVGYVAEASFFAVALAAAARERTDHIGALQQAGARFVPFAFLSRLGRAELPAVTLGDSAKAEMTVLFSDIRSFTSLVERLSPQQTLELVNAHLAVMTPAITQHGGFVDKYIGDAVMALFERPDDALRAAIACHAGLEASDQAVRVGIGLHTGELVLGTVGSEERLSCTVLGDSVNLAARVESLTKRYGAALLVTEHTVARLQRPDDFHLRRVDRVAVKGKSEAVALYEVLDALPDAARARRIDGAATFDEAQAAFERGEIDAALEAWRGLGATEDDPALRLAVERAQARQGEALPEGWAGVTRLDTK